ncbi:MAG: hypothetical protein H6742_08685 [Alphaproteobacteria bacterium]|nr:hypothetical protein [Alphaproteobacteria bacterium]
MSLPSAQTPLLRWGLVFLACPLALDEDAQRGLVQLAARAWFEDEPVIAFDWEGLHGVLRASSDVQALGNFVGQQFEAEVEGDAGKGTVRFLVTEAQLQAARGVVAEA